jgi:hypothetical protein
MKSIHLLCARVAMIFGSFLPVIASAQVSLGSRCDNLESVSGQQVISVVAPVAVNQWIIVSAAANNESVGFAPNEVTDSAGNSYPIYDATLMAASSGALATFAGHAAAALNIGDTITVTYSAIGSTTTQACVQAGAFSGVLQMPTDPSDSYGENKGNGTSMSVSTDTPTQFGSDLVYSAFASAGTPGTMTATAPAQALGQVCSSDASLCLLPAWNLGSTEAGVTESAAGTNENSANWGALLITFQNDDRIFANGFEAD